MSCFTRATTTCSLRHCTVWCGPGQGAHKLHKHSLSTRTNQAHSLAGSPTPSYTYSHAAATLATSTHCLITLSPTQGPKRIQKKIGLFCYRFHTHRQVESPLLFRCYMFPKNSIFEDLIFPMYSVSICSEADVLPQYL